MKKAKITTHELLISQKKVTLLELLDRLLDKGVMAKGEIVLSVAEIDLIYLNLGLLLSSVKTIEKARRSGRGPIFGDGEGEDDFFKEKNPSLRWLATNNEENGNGELKKLKVGLAPQAEEKLKTNIDPNNVEQGLAKLVLTLIELLRRLMEKQAIRRMEAGFLTSTEVERMGIAFKRLEERMSHLKRTFSLKDEDLNLDLGPLGELL